MARLRILSKNDFDKLYGTPNLKESNREFVFELDEIDTDHLNNLKDVNHKINYVLQAGYFKISNYFFNFSFQSVREDTKFIIEKFFPEAKFPAKSISKKAHYANRVFLVKKYSLLEYTPKFGLWLEKNLCKLAKHHIVPRFLFDTALDYCSKAKVIRPPYSVLQELISKVLSSEKNRVNNKLYRIMSKDLRYSLDSLLEKDDIFYKFTLVKRDQKDFTTGEIRNTVEKQKLLKSIYQSSLDVIRDLEISPQNVAHYAELAEQYTIYDLRSMKLKNMARLYLLCYVYHRFLKINDHLIASLVHKVRGYEFDADIYQRDMIYQAQMLDKDNREKTAKILHIYIDPKIVDEEVRNEAFSIVPEKEFPSFIKTVRNPNLKPDYYRWEYYKNHSHAIKQNIRMTFKALDFQTKSDELKVAIDFMRIHFNSNKSFSEYGFEEVPTDFIPSHLKRYVVGSLTLKDKITGKKRKIKIVDPDTYEFMLYHLINKGIEHGKVTIRDSITYKHLDDELFSAKVWEEEKDDIIQEASAQLIGIDLAIILNELEGLVSVGYKDVNRNIATGANNKIKFKKDKKGSVVKWHLPYKKTDDSVNNPFFEGLDLLSLNQIIRFADEETSFMEKFNHILPTHAKNKPIESNLSACLVAKATGIDIGRMKDICDVRENDLISTQNNFIRHKTLIPACDKVINHVAALPIFNKYNLDDYGVHASVDGQKLETRYHTIKARYSSKYFGLGKGVVSYTLFANCLPLSTKIIGANEHESHYLFDAIKNNTSDVEIKSVSGDMHSINKVNFALLHMFGYRFMPRFTKLDQKAANNLVSFDKIDKYDKHLIKPSKQVNKALILRESDNILRILVTLALKENTQSNIIRKLSSYKSNDTLKALIELDKIIMTLYILDYIDDENMRKTVHRSLNRGESYHQLKSAILRVAGRKLAGKTERDLAINNECARLIALCIIFYNASLLSKIYEYYISKNLSAQAKQVIKLSPVAWIHVNLVGKYEFNSDLPIPNPDLIMEQLVGKLDVMIFSKKEYTT